MKKAIVYVFAAVLGMVFFAACENLPDDALDQEEELTMAEEEIEAMKSLEAVEQDVNSARFAAHYPGPHGRNFLVPRWYLGENFPDCATVTVDRDSFPKTVTIEYGEDCVNRHGRQVTGTVIITLSDSVTTPGSTYTVEYIDLMIGKREYDMVAEFTNEGKNEAEHWVVSSDMDLVINFNDTLVIHRVFSYEKEWLEGFATPRFTDNIFLKTGGGTITINDNLVYEREITEPLLVDRACRFILSGVLEITRNGETMMIDFGDGTCDNIAVVTKDGESREIELISGKFKRKFHRRINNMYRNNGWW